VRTVIFVELVITAMAALAFVLLYLRSTWEKTAMGRHVMAFGVLTACDAAALAALAMGVRVSMWVFTAIYGAGALVACQRLWLLIRAQRRS
jgi:hypothetical protein